MKLWKKTALLLAMTFCSFADDYPKLIARWDFSKPDTLTAGTFPLKLRKGAVIKDGLLISQTEDIVKIPGGAVTLKIHPELDMKNAFSAEAVFEVDKTSDYKMIFDNKYNFRTGYMGGFMLSLDRQNDGRFRPYAAFGFGKDSSQVFGNTVVLEPGKRHTLRMHFNGIGKVQFYINGKPRGSGKVKPGSIAQSRYAACIGDRAASNFRPFGRGIAKFSLYEERPVSFKVTHKQGFRNVFERGEKNAFLHYIVCNNTGKDMSKLKLFMALGSEKTVVPIENLKAFHSEDGKFLLDTDLLPGTYTLKASLRQADGREIGSDTLSCTIVPAYGDFLPRALTGFAKLETAREFGFTHLRSYGISLIQPDGISNNTKSLLTNILDRNLSNGLYLVFNMNLLHSHYAKGKNGSKFLRRNRKGETYRFNPLEVSNPELIRKGCITAEQCAKAVGEHPALDMAIINTEVRDSMQPSFGGIEEENFKEFAGYPVPPTVVTKYPAPYRSNPAFPWDRVLPEDHKELTYYRWLWKDGDGWNNIHSLTSDIVHKYLTHHHTTHYEPAVRNPPCWGAGGRVDALSQWTYTYPDPAKINQALDELQAMADEHDKGIFKETQIIWYRSQVAPANEKPSNIPEWVSKEPDAVFITIPPDCLREAIWCDISHRVQGLMFHGSPCLFPGDQRYSKGYRYTNPQTKYVFKDIVSSVLKPLGPVIKRIPERMPDVAILESFTASIYAPNHITNGWSNKWTADLHLALQWAHIQPSVIYEEHLLTGKKMENIKIILLPGCEVLSENILKKLKEFQKRGVILIADEFLLPALMPDYRISSVIRTGNPKYDKMKLQKLGQEIAAVLKGRYTSPATATDPDIILRRRGTDDADYLFIVNDKRTFGSYLGPWRKVMEKGLPVSGTVTVNHPVKMMYDLVRHTPMTFKKTGKGISFQVELAPGDGRMLLLLNQKISSIDLKLPTQPLVRKDAFSLNCSVKDEKGSAIRAIIPLEVQLTDAKGTVLPGSGFYAAVNGKLSIHERLATNMSPGKVTVSVKDLASGLKVQRAFEVIESGIR